jgi:diadenosine tetraphosphatase ApaH/serine/threonine PP2A family protein phosphatase
MKIAIISDIHANIDALEAMLKRLEAVSIDKLVCLGDIVGYGASPEECVTVIRERCDLCVLGNHDAALAQTIQLQYFNAYARSAIEWSRKVMSDENMDYLRSLPMSIIIEDVLLVHATPKDPAAWNYVHTADDAVPNFDAMSPSTVCFVGHSHIPVRFDNEDKSRMIINVGSIGQPRDRDPRASCGLYDTETRDFQWIREPYDTQKAAQRIREAKLPEFLASRLFIGM